MPLTSTQLSEIKDFIHSRGFTHIEVEMEILDHVASAVESKLEVNPNKSLAKAIHEVHAGFGVMGFSVMEDHFRKSFGKAFRGQVWRVISNYVWRTKVLITLASFSLFLSIGQMILPFSLQWQYKGFFYLLGMAVAVVTLLSNSKIIRKWSKRSLVVRSASAMIVFSFTIFGQGFGMVIDAIYSTNQSVSIFIFALFATITVLYGFIYSEIINWSFNWANERYLKYA